VKETIRLAPRNHLIPTDETFAVYEAQRGPPRKRISVGHGRNAQAWQVSSENSDRLVKTALHRGALDINLAEEAISRRQLTEGRNGHRLELVETLVMSENPTTLREALTELGKESAIRQTAELYGLWAEAYLKLGQWNPAREMGLRSVASGGEYPAYFERLKKIETAAGDLPRARLYERHP
jgi:hypothetical protein